MFWPIFIVFYMFFLAVCTRLYLYIFICIYIYIYIPYDLNAELRSYSSPSRAETSSQLMVSSFLNLCFHLITVNSKSLSDFITQNIQCQYCKVFFIYISEGTLPMFVLRSPKYWMHLQFLIFIIIILKVSFFKILKYIIIKRVGNSMYNMIFHLRRSRTYFWASKTIDMKSWLPERWTPIRPKSRMSFCVLWCENVTCVLFCLLV